MKLTVARKKANSPAKGITKNNSFPIVAIGASAGGLEAVTQLLQNLPPNTGMAFIYVQHLSPDHKSILTSILGKVTLMKVLEVTNRIQIKPDHFYVIPPDKEMAVLDGHIKLKPRRKDRVANLPIDTFFCSLAEKHKQCAIGIILSGSASDGTRGLSAIKEAGGLTFAQDDTAKVSSMPKSAIAAGAVDFILSPKEIARELTRLSKDYTKRDVMRAMPTLIDKHVPDKAFQNKPASDNRFDSAMDAVLLSRYVPASVLINHAMEILLFRGATDLYLRHSSGKANLNILKMIPAEIAFELRSAISKAIKTKHTIRKAGIEMNVDNGLRMITIEVTPIEMDEPLLLILFTGAEALQHDTTVRLPDAVGKHKPIVQTASGIRANERTIERLRKELLAMRADVQSFTQEQESFNLRLQSANEEVVSSNEELQSVNEELETSKEEIEAANEELTTSNQELQTRNDLLNESYDYSEAIINTIHEPMIILDKDLRVKSANESFYKCFRVTRDETEKTLLYDLGHKQWNISRLRELLEDIIPKNTRFHDFEVTHTFHGIGQKIMLLNARRIVQKSHGEQLILLAINDITERAMLQLKEKAFLEKDIRERKSSGLVLEKAVDERTKELGLANKELAFQNEEKEKRAAELIIANKELVFQNEEKGKRAAESILANKELAFQIEEKRKRSAELIIANGELAFENHEKEKRAAELIIANKELAFQNEEKEKRAAELIIANTELQSFAYISSHDLQEPLRKIQTLALRILEKEHLNLSQKGKDYFSRMQTAASRMQKLIEDLLAFSRLNITERKFENTDLNKIVEEVKTELKEVILAKHAIIEATELCEVPIIPFQFHQLMHNLIGNALKFSKPDHPPHITIKSEYEKGKRLNNEKLLAETKYCHITVFDDGIGFDPQYKDRIFEVFQKLHGKDEYAGTGIGLAIVKKVVENHNGSITVTSKLDEGATFHIYIPVSDKVIPVAKTQREPTLVPSL